MSDADLFTVCGKHVLFEGVHWADARSAETALVIARLMNRSLDSIADDILAERKP